MLRNLIFAVVIYIAAFLLYIYPISAFGHLTYETAVLSMPVMAATMIVTGIVFYYLRTHATSRWLSGFTHYGMGVGFLGMVIMSAGLVMAAILPEASFEIGLICAAILCATSLMAIIRGRQVRLKTLSLTSPKLSSQTQFVFISDVHLGSNPKQHLQTICDKISQLDYDAVLIGGDLFDSSAFEASDLAPLRGLKAPIYFVTGNHEFYVKDHSAKLAQLSDYNIQLIDNQAISLADVSIIGIGDNQGRERQRKIANALVDDARFNLLLVHQPGIWPDVPHQADFMISGHTHNGQIFPFNLLVRLQFQAVYGWYNNGITSLYVSSGSGTWGPPMRLGTHNEIIHLTLKGA